MTEHIRRHSMNRLIELSVLITLTILIIPIWSFAQVKMAPILLDQYDDSVSVNDIFTNELKNLLQKLKGSPKTDMIFVAVSPNNIDKALEIRMRAKKLFSDLGYSDRQFYISHPRSRYWPSITRTEIWLVGRNNQAPYAISQIQDECLAFFSPEIVGQTYVNAGEKLEYEANRIMDWPKRFIEIKWSVKGGTVIDGQGTRRIRVKPQSDKTNELEIGLEVTYSDSPCLVPSARPFSTTIER